MAKLTAAADRWAVKIAFRGHWDLARFDNGTPATFTTRERARAYRNGVVRSLRRRAKVVRVRAGVSEI